MIENLPSYISIVFILTTFLTIGFLFYAIRQVNLFQILPGKIITSAILLWLLATATLAFLGFYQNIKNVPPKVFLFGAFPALFLIVLYFIFYRQDFIEKLPIKTLTILHIIRIPVEIVLLWLANNGQVSPLMTFEGWNFDILSGITAPIIYWLAFRNNQTNRTLLIVWNIFALGLLLTIITIAFLTFPSPFQQLSFEQPNRAVMFFPFIWLPGIVVPIVFFSHLVSLWKLFTIKKEAHL
jgi:hypothetical protein